MCAPVVRVSNLLNTQDVEGLDDIWISAGRSYAVPVTVNVPDTVLIWKFSTQPKVCHNLNCCCVVSVTDCIYQWLLVSS